MKSLLLLSLLSIQTASAQLPWWPACKKICWKKYVSCKEDVKHERREQKKVLSHAELELLDIDLDTKKKACSKHRRDCIEEKCSPDSNENH